MCFICAEDVVFWALGECGHRTCHTCSIRLRALYKKRDCTFCKTECDKVIFTASATLMFEDSTPATFPFADNKLGIHFETREQMEDSLALLRFNCPNSTCDAQCLGWNDLKRHARQEHNTPMCDLCCTHKKIFAHEHTLYTPKELQQHTKDEHHSCEFCRKVFYDADLLWAHCRDAHEECFICVRRGIRHEYHLNYDQLERHFKSAHYLCPHPTCLGQKFVVFESELDLQAHSVEVHGAALADQRSRRDARRIETNFTYEAESSHSNGRGGSRAGASRGRGGGRGGREQPAPVTTAFVSTPDEPNRARVIPGLMPPVAGGARAARFGAGLTHDAPPHRVASGSSSSEPSRSATPVGGSLNSDPLVVAQHAALMRKVAEAVSTEAKIGIFKLAVRAYRGGEVSADDLVDQLWNVFDERVDVASSIITSLADLLDDAEKRSHLLSALRDRRIEQNQFPSLAPLAPVLNGVPTTTSATSSRNLNNRNPRSGTQWARVEQAAAATAPRNPFPALGPSASSNVVGLRQVARSSNANNTPWAGAAAPPTPRGPTPTPSPPLPVSRPATTSAIRTAPPRTTRHDYPSLPSSSNEVDRRARMRAALSKPALTIVDDDQFPVAGATPWGGGTGSGHQSGSSTREASPERASGEAAAGRKKKGKGKVLLMSHGINRG